MTITHNGYNFGGSGLHDDIIPQTTFDLNDTRFQFAGVIGETEIQDAPKGRDLSCSMHMSGYASAVALLTAFGTINSKINELTGTVTDTNLSISYGNCVFKGATRGNVLRDAKDNTWFCDIVLHWRQLKKDI